MSIFGQFAAKWTLLQQIAKSYLSYLASLSNLTRPRKFYIKFSTAMTIWTEKQLNL